MKVNDFKNIQGIIESNGEYSNTEISITTDSRSMTSENVFLALKGENFDGFDYMSPALEKGVEVVIYTHLPERTEIVKSLKERYKDVLFIAVGNTLKYLQDSASWWMREWQKSNGGITIGLTGSNGKTTTKELLFAQAEIILKDKVLCTAGNFNNHIGVPLSVLRIKNKHKLAIIEMGTNHPGEIEVLCNIANPKFGLITNVGAAHLEFFKDESGVLKEKSSLYDYINKHGGEFYLNMSDNNLKTLEITKQVYPFGEDESEFYQELNNENIEESYNIWNLKASLFTLSKIYPDKEELLIKNAATIKLPANKRSEWIEKSGKRIFLDAYNANPTSMKSSLESFANKYGDAQEKSLYVVGDMNELGESCQKFHEDISILMNDLKIKNAVFVGRYAHYYESKFNGSSKVYTNREDLLKDWNKVSNSYQYIFLKASRSLQLEALIDITD